MYAGFDPERSEQDRRILYEVTGMRLYSEEFQEKDSTSSEEENEEEETVDDIGVN